MATPAWGASAGADEKTDDWAARLARLLDDELDLRGLER
jgi:hypothetical protein